MGQLSWDQSSFAVEAAFAEMKWLEDNFDYLDDTSSAFEREQHALAFTLRLISGVLMPDKSRNLIHLRWLLQLIDLKEAGRLNWRSAVLATLY
ncbi:hypothetical protein PVK06_006952 [Gossypium arboreum]|uniref:Aminotransferase-like plant mobile domain-containing protein n=1 Tax=Gossypium arboreum TaxID=29729 RepID=A0ABR0QG01_GOSAR|nr:hypothetical protein PVK06_006952 [Gossypium arboreum]